MANVSSAAKASIRLVMGMAVLCGFSRGTIRGCAGFLVRRPASCFGVGLFSEQWRERPYFAN